jgi:hypothetical protein
VSPGIGEPTLKYHPSLAWDLTRQCREPCMVGSLTGVVASKSVTEASKGLLNTLGNRVWSAIVQAGLTVRPTGRAGGKPGYSDPVVLYGRAIAQRIKGTPGITG